MALQPDSRLGSYQIVAAIGKGGMGEVYQAHDPRLQRDVAIKVLPEDLAGDAQRLARFEREARLLAALNHPHIATIHGLEESNGVRFLVMELVPGQTLAERLGGGPLPVTEALPFARQIAEALAAAHDKGIVHRDLKPANVKLTAAGKVKLLDFGLAKSLPTEAITASKASTGPGDGTQAGVIMGTPAYMSPEQARGKPVDQRTDIWSFGCVLYESLAGKPPFTGETAPDVLAAILEREPNWTALPAATPVAIQGLVRRCLRKDPDRRLRDIRDALTDLDEAVCDLVPAPNSGRTSTPPGGAFANTETLAPVASRSAVLTVLPASSPSPLRRLPRFLVIAFGMLCLVWLVVLSWVVVAQRVGLDGHRPVGPVPGKSTVAATGPVAPNSIAVLPVEDKTGTGRTIADLVPVRLTGELVKQAGLQVTSQNAIAPMRQNSPWTTPLEAGKMLHVSTVLAGTVTSDLGNEYLLHVELLEVKTGALLWANTYRLGWQNADTAKALDKAMPELAEEIRKRMADRMEPQHRPEKN